MAGDDENNSGPSLSGEGLGQAQQNGSQQQPSTAGQMPPASSAIQTTAGTPMTTTSLPMSNAASGMLPPYFIQAIPPPTLHSFSGEDRAFTAWFVEDCRSQLSAMHAHESQKVHLLTRSLSGQAARLINSLAREDRDTVEKVLSQLSTVYGDQRDLRTILADFFGRTQRPGEDLVDYWASLSGLARRASALGSTLTEANTVSQFVEGLRAEGGLRKDMRAYLRTHPAATLEEVRDAASRWVREDANDSSTGAAAVAMVASLRSQIEALTASVGSLTRLHQEQQQAAWQPAQRSQRPPRGRKPFSGHCYNCHETGHRWAQCPLLPRPRFPHRYTPQFPCPPQSSTLNPFAPQYQPLASAPSKPQSATNPQHQSTHQEN